MIDDDWAIERKEIVTYSTALVNFENIMVRAKPGDTCL